MTSVEIPNSKFLQAYKHDMTKAMMKINSLINKDKLDKFLDNVIAERLQNPVCELDNNVTGEHKEATLLGVFDWALERKPIIAGNGTFYMNQHEAMNPIANMLDSFLKERKAIKKEMFNIEDIKSHKYQDLDRAQLNVKILVNSYYGGSGAPTAPFYSLWSGPATTLTAQSVISTTENTFEAFIGDNYEFINTTELMSWLKRVDKEYDFFEIDEWLNIPDKELVKERLLSKLMKCDENDEIVINDLVEGMEPQRRAFLYYKNNLIQFLKDHKKVSDILVKIISTIEDMGEVDQNDPNWLNKIDSKYKDIAYKCKTAKEWNKIVNREKFLDPNDLPESVGDMVKKFSAILEKYVYVRYLAFDRIYRLRNMKRSCVTVIDTDSNILSLDTVVNYIFDDLLGGNREAYNRSRLSNAFIIVNTLTFAITNVVQDILLYYGKCSNIPEEFRSRFNMKNEFFFSKLVVGKTKKRYLSRIMLREGNYIHGGKVDIKGFDFKKSAVSEDTEKFFTNLINTNILHEGEIDIPILRKKLLEYRDVIIETINNKDTKYLPLGTAKDINFYKQPETEQVVKGYLTWNMLNPDNQIETPSKVKLLKLKLFNESDLDIIRGRFPNEAKIISEKIFNDTTGVFVKRKYDKAKGKETIKQHGCSILAIPLHTPIPDWCLDLVDHDTIVNNILSSFKGVTEIFGIKSATVGKSNDKMNRKSDMITNIIKF